MKWEDVKKEIKSLPEIEKKAIEILAKLEIDYDEKKIKKIVNILS